MIALGGLLLGLVEGAGTVLLADQLDHTIKDSEDIRWLSDLRF